MKKYIFFLFFSVIFACSKEPSVYDLEIESIKPQLCMSGFVSSDSIYVLLTKSISRNTQFNGTDPFLLQDTFAVITVLENGTYFCTLRPKKKIINKGFPNEYNKFYYCSDKKITDGSTYTIEAVHKDFEGIAAKTTIPHKVNILSVDTSSILMQTFIQMGIVQDGTIVGYKTIDTFLRYKLFIINFIDPGDEENFYRAKVTNRFMPQGAFIIDPVVEYANYNLFSDKFINGKTIGLKVAVQDDLADSLSLKLFSVNEDYYKYHIGVARYKESEDDQYREPVSIYSNVSNGLGIISGYTVSELKFFKNI